MKELIKEGIEILKSIDAELKKINLRTEEAIANRSNITCPDDLIDKMNLPPVLKDQVKNMLGGLSNGG